MGFLLDAVQPFQGRNTVDVSHSGPVTFPTRRSESNQKVHRDAATKLLLKHLSLPTTHPTLPSCCSHHSHLCPQQRTLLTAGIALCPCPATAVYRYPHFFWLALWSLLGFLTSPLRAEFMISILLYYFLYTKVKPVQSGKWFRAWFLDLRTDSSAWITSIYLTPFSVTQISHIQRIYWDFYAHLKLGSADIWGNGGWHKTKGVVTI